MKVIIFILSTLFIGLNLLSQEAENISNTGKVVIIGPKMDFNVYTKHYVEDKIAVWQKKGEFEKILDYKARVNEQSRKAKADEFASEAIEDLEFLFMQIIKWEQFSLKRYDADNETYLLSHPIIGDIAVPVEISSAPSFKQNFKNLSYSGYDFILANNKFNLIKLKITDTISDKHFYYDNKQDITYVAQTIDYNFSDINFDMPQPENN